MVSIGSSSLRPVTFNKGATNISQISPILKRLDRRLQELSRNINTMIKDGIKIGHYAKFPGEGWGYTARVKSFQIFANANSKVALAIKYDVDGQPSCHESYNENIAALAVARVNFKSMMKSAFKGKLRFIESTEKRPKDNNIQVFRENGTQYDYYLNYERAASFYEKEYTSDEVVSAKEGFDQILLVYPALPRA